MAAPIPTDSPQEFFTDDQRPLQHRPMIEELTLGHGPLDMLARLFARVDREARERGIVLSFGTAREMVEANRANRKNWLPIVPVFDPANGGIDDSNTFCVLGRTDSGEVVAAHAARLFDWSSTNFVEEASSLRLFYADPDRMKQPGEVCELTTTNAAEIRGRVVYSGAAWVHPDYRKLGLSAIVPRAAKAYAHTLWKPDFISSLMTEAVHRQGFAPRFSYDRIDWEVRWTNSPLGTLRLAIVWMDDAHLLQDLAEYLASQPTQINAGISERRA